MCEYQRVTNIFACYSTELILRQNEIGNYGPEAY